MKYTMADAWSDTKSFWADVLEEMHIGPRWSKAGKEEKPLPDHAAPRHTEPDLAFSRQEHDRTDDGNCQPGVHRGDAPAPSFGRHRAAPGPTTEAEQDPSGVEAERPSHPDVVTQVAGRHLAERAELFARLKDNG